MGAPRNGCGDKTMETKMIKKARQSGKPSKTKAQVALSLLRRSKGASVAEMQDAMGWQAHSVRGFLAGTVKKMPGVILVSEKPETGPLRYRVEAAGA